MIHLVRLSVALIVIAGCVSAQQVGTPNRDYTINGNGSGAASHVSTAISVPSPMNNVYSTLDAGAPVLWLYAPSGTIGWFTTATNSLDIGPNGLQSLLQGNNMFGLPANAVVTDAGGMFSLSINIPGPIAGTHFVAFAHVAPTSPDGVWVSQTHQVTFSSGPPANPLAGQCTMAGGTSIGGGDDFSVLMNFGFPFPYFGGSYTQCFVGSNGYVTFNAGDSTFTESVGGFRAGPPRISQYWDDLTLVGFGGSIGVCTFFTDSVSTWEVCFINAPEYVNSGSNTFRVKAFAGSHIEMGYNASMTSSDSLVGLSPGGNIDPVGLPLNLSAGGNAIPPFSAPYELFPGGFDLKGFTITWTTDAAGNPVSQN